MTILPLQPRPRRKSIAAALRLAILLAVTVAPAAVAAEPPTTVTVTFQGIKTVSGRLMVALTADPTAFAGKTAPSAQLAADVTGSTTTVTFTGVKPGIYAIRAFHDLHGDGKLSVNPFGIPTEPYAFSRDARGAMGPPSWEAALFEVKSGENSQIIDID